MPQGTVPGVGMTVLLKKKMAKKSLPELTKKEAKELRRLNPHPAKNRRKELKRNERLVKQIGE